MNYQPESWAEGSNFYYHIGGELSSPIDKIGPSAIEGVDWMLGENSTTPPEMERVLAAKDFFRYLFASSGKKVQKIVDREVFFSTMLI